MSSRQHQSPVLMEQSVSPPHLLSPELHPSTSMPQTSSESVDRPSNQESARPAHVADAEGPSNQPLAELPANQEMSSETESAAGDAVTAQNSTVEDTTRLEATDPEPLSAQLQASTNSAVNAATTEPAPIEQSLDETEAASPNQESTSGAGVPIEHVTEVSPEVQSAPSVAGDAVDPAPAEQNLEADSAPAPPPESVDNTHPWVQYEEDTSTPDEEEIKEIVELEAERPDASNIKAMEDQLFTDLDDPEQRPCKKLRMSWNITGIRGTREKPNLAKVMNSPAVCVDGLYWSIKFYPRGDNCGSLSAFVRCSRIPPKQLEEMPEYTFSFFEGPPEADFGQDYEPTVEIAVPNTLKEWEKPKPLKKDSVVSEAFKKPDNDDGDATHERSWGLLPDDDDLNDSNDDSEYSDVQDWRVPAQLGMSIYNPAEPRTSQHQSDGHQFSKNCDDWGWVNFVGPWDEVHKRKRGQRKPLLQNDRLAIDAYIRIYDDPTEALWWHDSKSESQWPSKQLAGYYPMGTPALYHAPAVAGITAWTLLSPFRKVIQSHDGHKWRKDSTIAPTPLISQTQLVLHQMRNLVGDCYVNVYKIIEELMEVDEPWEDVKSFWEVYRRGLELEFENDKAALTAISDIFDADGKPFPMPSLPAADTHDIASGLTRYFENSGFKGCLPNFLPVMINRQQFDQDSRQWKLHQHRVRLSDELDLRNWCSGDDAQYTLYGFVVHVGSRNSGKFYTILRPGGMGSKWLAFEDGNGNKIFSYTKKRIQDYEGLEGKALKEFSGEREKVYMAMYIRTSRFADYLPKEMETFILPRWLRPWIDGHVEIGEELAKEEMQLTQAAEQKQSDEGITVEIYLDECVQGRENMLDLHDIRCSSEARACSQTLMVATDKTFAFLRSKIAEALEISDVSKVALWEIGYRHVGRYSRAELETVSWRRKVKRHIQPGEVFQMWLTILPHDGRKTSYQDLLPKIAEMDLDKKAPSSPPVEETIEEVKPDQSSHTGNSEEATPVAEQPIDVNHPTETSSSHTEDSTTSGGIATPATGDTGDSAIDMEQTSVQAAVVGDVEQTQSVLTTASADPANETSIIEPSSASVDSTDSPLVPEANDEESGLSPEQVNPVEHGHLVEAVQSSSPSAVTTTEPQAGNDDVHGPTPDDEISAEDAAAIAALLAADAAETAAELNLQSEEAATGADSDQRNAEPQDPIIESETIQDRSITPQPLHVYGFLHVFNTDEQKFVAHAPFGPVIEHEIGAAVRKALNYTDDREVRIWRRDGPTGTSPVTASASFVSSNLADGFTLIVGDILSESKIDSLKQAGKFWQPAQLIKHLMMTRRRHPILSATSSVPVEISEFGGDYFKGPIVNGQPHGNDCVLITATGHTYEGSLVAGLKSGPKGKMTYQNGDIYTGEWLNDERHGKGEHLEARTGNRYVGGFENGKRWGEGVTYWKVADEQAAMCQICYGEEIDALFFDCGHVCACVECAERQRDNGCPICRKPVQQVVKMFRA